MSSQCSTTSCPAFGGAWNYPISVGGGSGSPHWDLMSCRLAINTVTHLELVEVSVVPQSFLP